MCLKHGEVKMQEEDIIKMCIENGTAIEKTEVCVQILCVVIGGVKVHSWNQQILYYTADLWSEYLLVKFIVDDKYRLY